jgi:hypothetical protein
MVSKHRGRIGRVNLSQAVLVFVVLAPGVVFGVFALLWLLGWVPGERAASRITGGTFSACALGVSELFWKLVSGGAPRRGGDVRQLVCGA